ncbi:hypothetical protein FOYG_17613, partial [Fusarium oxysporum NRRL 32931]
AEIEETADIPIERQIYAKRLPQGFTSISTT